MSNGHKRGDQFLLHIGTDPQNGMIVLTIPVGIFERQLRFANSAQPSESVWLRQCGLALQEGCQSGQYVLLSREEGVALPGYSPEGWQGTQFGVGRSPQQGK